MGATPMSDPFTELADRYWESCLSDDPLSATLLGDHRFDDLLRDLAPEATERRLDTLRSFRSELDLLTPADHRPGLLAELLATDLDNHIAIHTLRVEHMACDQMEGPHAHLMFSAPQLAYPEPADAAKGLERLDAVPAYLDQTLDLFRRGVAEGDRIPARCAVARVVSSVEAYLASPTDRDPFVTPGLPHGWSDADRAEWTASAHQRVESAVRPAFARFLNGVQSDILPVARPDDRPGCCHLPDGHELYQSLIRYHTSTGLTPDELHHTGRRIVEEELPREFLEVGKRLWGLTSLHEIYERAATDPTLLHTDAAEIIATAESSLRRAEERLDRWFGRLPKAPCTVAPIPEFLAADAPYAYYYPPAEDGSRGGTYFINTADPAQSSRTEAESIAFHEAIPGHHLQLAIAQELDDLTRFQRNSFHTAYGEGWALYAERLADEMGLYTGDIDLLGMLTADAWRAARLVVDTGLHEFGWSRRQALDYFDQHTPIPQRLVATEVDRYIAMPGQALAYKVGALEIERLRRTAETALGNQFDIRRFHDVVLGSGSVTLDILDRLVGDYIDQHRTDQHRTDQHRTDQHRTRPS